MQKTVFFIFLLSSASSFAKTVVLFNSFGPVFGYEKKVNALEEGDKIVFSTGKSFVIGKHLSHGENAGNNDRIFELGKRAAIRIPLNRDRVKASNQYWAGYRALQDFNVSVPKVFIAKKGEFTLVERYDKLFSLQDWAEKDFDFKGFDNHKVAQEFVAFALQARRFIYVGDSHPENIVYTSNGWLLVDWGSSHIFARKVGNHYLGANTAVKLKKKFGLDINDQVIGAREADGPGKYTREIAAQLGRKYRGMGPEELYIDQIEKFVSSSRKKTSWLGSFADLIRQQYGEHCGKLNMFVNTRGGG